MGPGWRRAAKASDSCTAVACPLAPEAVEAHHARLKSRSLRPLLTHPTHPLTHARARSHPLPKIDPASLTSSLQAGNCRTTARARSTTAQAACSLGLAGPSRHPRWPLPCWACGRAAGAACWCRRSWAMGTRASRCTPGCSGGSGVGRKHYCCCPAARAVLWHMLVCSGRLLTTHPCAGLPLCRRSRREPALSCK